MSIFGTITPTDKRTWQRRSLNVLSGIVAAADKSNIDPIDWTVTDGLTVHGRVPGHDAGARDLFEAWCRLLGAEVQREYTIADGTIRIHGEARRYRDNVTVVIVCEISPPTEET